MRLLSQHHRGCVNQYVATSFTVLTVIDSLMWFTMRNSYSYGSAQFWKSPGVGLNCAQVMITDNLIVATTNPIAIQSGDLGPLVVIGNTIVVRIIRCSDRTIATYFIVFIRSNFGPCGGAHSPRLGGCAAECLSLAHFGRNRGSDDHQQHFHRSQSNRYHLHRSVRT